MCQRFIEYHLASLGVLYVDGHFLPYFGFEPTLKSWYSLRRFAIKGNIQYFANDREQNPILSGMKVAFTEHVFKNIGAIPSLPNTP